MKKLAEFFKALGDETRLRILQLLSNQERCVCELIEVLDMSQPAVSHHLKILKQVGLVNDRRNGKWIFYSLNLEMFDQCQQALTQSFVIPIQENIKNGIPISQDISVCERLVQKSRTSA